MGGCVLLGYCFLACFVCLFLFFLREIKNIKLNGSGGGEDQVGDGKECDQTILSEKKD